MPESNHASWPTGGHASGDLRDAFLAGVHAFLQAKPGQPEPKVDLLGEMRTVSDLCGLLWTCTDMLPSSERSMLADKLGSGRQAPHTYATAARRLKRLVARAYSQGKPVAALVRSVPVPEAGLTFGDPRKALGKTQKQIASATGYPPVRISSMDAMTDMRLSTLDRLVHGLGARLRLVVEFQDREPAMLSGMGRPNAPNAQARNNARRRDRMRTRDSEGSPSPRRRCVSRDPRCLAPDAGPGL